jgi:hypothetical protein
VTLQDKCHYVFHYTDEWRIPTILKDGIIAGWDWDENAPRISIFAAPADVLSPKIRRNGIHPKAGKEFIEEQRHYRKKEIQVTIDVKMCIRNNIRWYQQQELYMITHPDVGKIPPEFISSIHKVIQLGKGKIGLDHIWGRQS